MLQVEETKVSSRQRHTAEMVKQVESLKPFQVIQKLKKYGVPEDSGPRGFEQARKIIFRGLPIGQNIKDLHEKVIIDCLNI